jgi:acyl-CoA synthetase (NDP forming)
VDAGKIKVGPAIELAAALFSPRAVALVGASGDAGKNTARPQRYLLKHGFTGKIFPVNPGRQEVQGLACFKSVSAIKEKVDHAFIMVPDVEAALEDCGAKGVAVATVFTDGFADAGAEGMARQQRLAARARTLGVRLLGPNSMGMINLAGRAAITVNAVLEMDAPPVGGTSIVSQSGTMLGTVLSRGAARGLGFGKLVSVGNEADLGVGEIVEMLAADRDTRSILLFLETVRDAEALARGARAAHAAGKPVIAYKLGRSSLGERLAQSHTGALAGEDAALDAYFRDCGIVRVDMLETLIEIGPLLAECAPPNHGFSDRRPPRVAVVTTTGGGAASVVDRLGLQGIEIASPDPRAPIIDLTMGRKAATYGAVVGELLAWEGCDAVLAVVGSSAMFHPQHAVEPIIKARRGTHGGNHGGAKPLAVFMTPQADESLALLAQAGIAGFRTPEACADALQAYFSWKSPREKPEGSPPAWPKDIPVEGKLTEIEALKLFSSLGVPVVESTLAQAPEFSHSLPYPVAAKIVSRDIAHKSDVGGVVLGLQNFKDMNEAIRKLPGNPQQVLIQRMESGLAEAIVGYRDDPVVGALVMVGAGGILAELYNDVALRLAPVDEAGALEMLAEVKGFAVLRGYRGLPQGDLAALAKTVAAMSRLALLAGRPVREAEANPVIVKARGAVAVDALVVLK